MIVVKCVNLTIWLNPNWLGINQVKLVVWVLIQIYLNVNMVQNIIRVGYNLVCVISNDFW